MIKEIGEKNIRQIFLVCFWHDRQSSLINIQQDDIAQHNGFTALSLLKAYKEGLQPLYRSGLIFQQDNTPIYTANNSKEWLESHGVWTMEWPPYSPDLKPIEHLWWALKRAVLKAYPNLKKKGSTEEARRHLIEAYKEQ